MDGNLDLSLDKLPTKRLDAIEENGVEHFPLDLGYDEKRVNLIRRIDFAWAVEREDPSKKQKKGSSSSEATAPTWQWQSLVENLQLAHQELSVIIDLINTVEANDAVTVAGMIRPKPLPTEQLSDLAVSTATKLQCFKHLGKYFKQSAKALEGQIAREARFYGALIRLQQNWKVKRHRVVPTALRNEGFYIDLFDSSLYDSTAVSRPSSISTVRIEHDPAGMLTLNLPPNSCRSLQFAFLGELVNSPKLSNKLQTHCSSENVSEGVEKDRVGDDECIKETHSVLREIHHAIFDEQVFDLANREAFNPSLGVNVTGIRENYLQLSIGQGASVFISLAPSRQDDQGVDSTVTQTDSAGNQNLRNVVAPLDTFQGKYDTPKKNPKFPNQACYDILLKQIFHEHVLVKARDGSITAGTKQLSNQSAKDELNLLGHFCLSLAHRIFSNKVLVELENLVSGVPYVQLMSHPTWHSRTSSWTISMNVPPSILQAACETEKAGTEHVKEMKSQFRTKVVINDDRIRVEGEGAPNVVGLFKRSVSASSMNKYDCNLADLPVILLQQIASQVIRWLHEEALMVGIKAKRDYLSLSFELEQGETLGLVAHVDPKDALGCISWWLVMDAQMSSSADGTRKLHHRDVSSDSDSGGGGGGGGSDTRKFLGYLSLDVLYSTLMDLVSLCNAGCGGIP